MISLIKGKIVDENNQPIPSATVYLSDAKGALINTNARVKADLDGNYTLPFAIPMPNLATGGVMNLPIAKYITAKYTGYPDKTVALPEKFISDTGVGNLNIPLTLKTQQIQEVTVTANKSKYDCEKGGGTWDEATKTCKLPKQGWWSKYKWWVIGGLALVATTTTVIVMVKNKNKGKGK